MNGLMHNSLPERFIEYASKNNKQSLYFIYILLQYCRKALLVHKFISLKPPLELLKRYENKVDILLVDDNNFEKFIKYCMQYDTVVIFDYACNNFEREYLKQFCRRHKKTVIVFNCEGSGVVDLVYKDGVYTLDKLKLCVRDYNFVLC